MAVRQKQGITKQEMKMLILLAVKESSPISKNKMYGYMFTSVDLILYDKAMDELNDKGLINLTEIDIAISDKGVEFLVDNDYIDRRGKATYVFLWIDSLISTVEKYISLECLSEILNVLEEESAIEALTVASMIDSYTGGILSIMEVKEMASNIITIISTSLQGCYYIPSEDSIIIDVYSSFNNDSKWEDYAETYYGYGYKTLPHIEPMDRKEGFKQVINKIGSF